MSLFSLFLVDRESGEDLHQKHGVSQNNPQNNLPKGAMNHSTPAMQNERIGCDAQRGKVGQVLGDITNTQHHRGVSSNGAKSPILSSYGANNSSLPPKNVNGTSTNNFEPEMVTPSESNQENKENENPNNVFQNRNHANNRQIVLYRGSSAIKKSSVAHSPPPKDDPFGQDTPWLSGYRPIRIPRPIKPILLPPHMMKIITSARTYTQWSIYHVRVKEIKSTEGLRCVNCSKTDGKIEKVFFPCEHMCVCTVCVEKRKFEVCPLCKQKIKLILNHTGKEHQEYEDWLYEFGYYIPEKFIKSFKKNSQKAINRAICHAKGEDYFDEDSLSPLGRIARKLIPSRFRLSFGQKNKALTDCDNHSEGSAFQRDAFADAGAMTPRASNVTLKYSRDSVVDKPFSSYHSPRNDRGRISIQSDVGIAKLASGGGHGRSRNAKRNNYSYL